MVRNPDTRTFGVYRLTLHPPSLSKENESLKLPQKLLDTLVLLVEAAGEPVAKSRFFEKVWDGAFVEDGNLTQTIFLLRRWLGRQPDGTEYIETVPRKGYRLAPSALRSVAASPMFTPSRIESVSPSLPAPSSPFAQKAMVPNSTQIAGSVRPQVRTIEPLLLYTALTVAAVSAAATMILHFGGGPRRSTN